jgi:hypothetical protein
VTSKIQIMGTCEERSNDSFFYKSTSSSVVGWFDLIRKCFLHSAVYPPIGAPRICVYTFHTFLYFFSDLVSMLCPCSPQWL